MENEKKLLNFIINILIKCKYGTRKETERERSKINNADTHIYTAWAVFVLFVLFIAIFAVEKKEN